MQQTSTELVSSMQVGHILGKQGLLISGRKSENRPDNTWSVMVLQV